MNAFRLMMFILFFNLALSIVTGLNIYSDVQVTVDPDYNVSDVSRFKSREFIWDLFARDVLASVITGLIVGMVTNKLAGVPGDAAFVYSTFGTFYVLKLKGMIDVFWRIACTQPEDSAVGGVLMIGCAIITIVAAFALVTFLMQLVKGSWFSME